MQHKNTVTINGVVYDIDSGKPIAKSTEGIVAKHNITRFATPAQVTKAAQPDIPATKHPVVTKAHAAQAKHSQPRVAKPAHVIKHQAIQAAMEQTAGRSRKPFKLKPHIGPLQKALRTGSVAIMALLVGAYLMYLSMPSITTNIAAAQAGIRATYPSYTPSGYALAGPVAFNNGIVTMQFTAKAAPVGYTVAQARSTWDSSAVRENYILPATGNDFATTQANGLTIYTYGKSAAWVNGGILYTIKGDAPLSDEQVQRIAVSM